MSTTRCLSKHCRPEKRGPASPSIWELRDPACRRSGAASVLSGRRCRAGKGFEATIAGERARGRSPRPQPATRCGPRAVLKSLPLKRQSVVAQSIHLETADYERWHGGKRESSRNGRNGVT